MPQLSSAPRALILCCTTVLLAACDPQEADAPQADAARQPQTAQTTPAAHNKNTTAAHYVGSQECQLCHMTQQQDWLHSDHAKAMMPANDKSVLGDFADQSLIHHGQTSRFQQPNNQYQVITDQDVASTTPLSLPYTFGIFPLQQYLTALPDGHWQALPFAWDSRSQTEGGQRWFHLYSHENIAPGDPLHWRAASHGANHMCIECHTTDFQKNYQPDKQHYDSRWQETGVGCESCHGPGSNHVHWARSADKSADSRKGWDITLTSGDTALWQHQQGHDKPRRLQAGDAVQVERCAQCHSRRSRIDASNRETALLDAFLPSLLDESLYHADGQIQDEVYEYGSFLQSRMHQQDVTCSNCHNPHSGKPKVDGNGLCLQCHEARFDTPQHTLHNTATPGSACIDCHMPATTYMQVDARRDHSLRIPRPDLSETLGTPNACNQCHTDKSARWAASAIDTHIGTAWRKSHYGTVLAEARHREPAAYDRLTSLITDIQQPAIVRATALSLLPGFPQHDWRDTVISALGNADALMRLGALRAAEALPPQDQLRWLPPLLRDERRAIRIETARLLAGQPSLQADSAFLKARDEYIASQQLNADRAAGLANLAGLATREQRVDEAERLLRQAIALEPYYVPASVNLADLYRQQQRDGEAGNVLLAALKQAPDSPDLHLAYGLWLVRQQKLPDAMEHLQQAVQHSEDPYYRYVLALGLQQQGKYQDALNVLGAATTLPLYHREVHALHVEIAWQMGDKARALAALQAWEQRDAADPALATWKQRIKQ